MAAPRRSVRFGEAAWTALEVGAAFALRSGRLAPEEHDELAALRERGARNLTWAEQARFVLLVRRGALPEQLPQLPQLPQLERGGVGRVRETDPLDRLSKLADLRDRGVIDDAEFARLKARILGDV